MVVFLECPLDEASRRFLPPCQNPSQYKRVGDARIVPLKTYNITDTEVTFDMSALGEAKKPSYLNVKVSLDIPHYEEELDA